MMISFSCHRTDLKPSVDYLSHSKKCIIQCTGPGHEIMGNVLMQFWATLGNSNAHQQVVRNTIPMGTAEIDLQNGAKKQPDYSFVDDNPNLLPEEKTFPTTIFEVAYNLQRNIVEIGSQLWQVHCLLSWPWSAGCCN